MTTRTVTRAEHRHEHPPSRIEHVTELTELFGLLSDPTRLLLLLELLDGDEVCVSDLSTRIGAAESTVSHSLRLLKASGVVTGRREKNWVYYSLVDEHTRLLVAVAAEHISEAH